MTESYYDVRASCGCGRFIAQSAIRSEDFRDDSYFYGIRTEMSYTCSQCGVVQGEPRMTAVREYSFDIPPP